MRIHPSDHAARELAHSRLLSEYDPEDAWGWKTKAGRVRFKRRAQMIVECSKIGPQQRVLEIGCGTGLLTKRLAHSGADITAVDVSPELLSRAQTRKMTGRVNYRVGRFEDLELEGPFDAIVGSSVLHHLDVGVALTRMRGLLTPAGRICFAEPNLLNPQVFLERKLSFLRGLFWYVSEDETALIRYRFSKALEKIGFDSVTITPFDWLHPSTPSFLISSVLQVGKCLEKVPVVREISGSLLIVGRNPG